MLNTKDLVALTEYQQVGCRLREVQNWYNKNNQRHTQPNLILLFNEIYYFTSTFDFEQSFTVSIKTTQCQQPSKRLIKNTSSYRKK